MKELKAIEYLPKWCEKADLKAKQKELDECRKRLLNTSKLTTKEREELAGMEFALCGDRYSRNYLIRRLNEIIRFVNYR